MGRRARRTAERAPVRAWERNREVIIPEAIGTRASERAREREKNDGWKNAKRWTNKEKEIAKKGWKRSKKNVEAHARAQERRPSRRTSDERERKREREREIEKGI